MSVDMDNHSDNTVMDNLSDNTFLSEEVISQYRPLVEERLLKCKYEVKFYAVPVLSDITYPKLCETITTYIPNLSGISFTLMYSIKEGPTAPLRDDLDICCMMLAQKNCSAGWVDILVMRDFAGTSGGPHTTDLVYNHGLDGFNVDDVLPKEQRKVLLSRLWRELISHVGQIFEGGVTDFRNQLAMYAAEVGFDYHFDTNNAEKVTVVCTRRVLEGCKWRVYASLCPHNGYFVIRTLNNDHTCSGVMRKPRSSILNSKVVSSLISEEVKSNPGFTPKYVQTHIKSVYGFEIPYHTCTYALAAAKSKVIGNDEKSFARIGRYVELINESNPGSYCVLEVANESRRFERVFVSFAASRNGFMFCRPFLCFDGTFLKSKYKGTLLVAVGKNANNGLYPLAFAVVSSETYENWKWFVEHVAVILNDQGREVTLMSDRHAGLVRAVRETFPAAPYAFCIHHMKGNLLAKFPGSYNKGRRKSAVKYFMRCAYAPTREMFHESYNKLLAVDRRRIEAFLRGTGFSNWANSYFDGERFGDMASNIAESFNSWIGDERHYPITELLDGIRLKMMTMISVRHDDASHWTSILSPMMETKLVESVYLGRQFSVVKSNDVEYEVEDGMSTFTVNVIEGSCTCQMWRLNRFPCKHGAAVFKRANLNIYDHVAPYFSATAFRACYSFPIHPVVVDPYNVTDIDGEAIILPPQTVRQAGRPATRRLRSASDLSQRMKRTRCGKVAGHNRRSCKEII